MEDLYGIPICYMFYNSLISAVPVKWKQLLKCQRFDMPTRDNLTDPNLERNKILDSLTSKTLYWQLISRIISTPTAVDTWMSEFPFLNDTDFRSFYTLSYKITKDARVQALQYKILNRIIATRRMLYIWQISDSDKCQYCDMTETIEHFFYECAESSLFWKHAENWIYKLFNVKVSFSVIDILFGVPCEAHNELLNNINYILLQGKVFLYHMRLKNKYLFFLEFAKVLRHELDVEYSRYELYTDGTR